MRDYFSFLTGQPGTFLSKITLLQERVDALIELEAHYAVEAYRPFLFDVYGVWLPRTLISAAPKRQSEFLAGRILAKVALER